MGRIIALVLLGLVAGCGGETPNPPLPTTQCVIFDSNPQTEICGRGGCSQRCARYGIACPTPLVLDQDPTSAKLSCKLPKPQTPKPEAK